MTAGQRYLVSVCPVCSLFLKLFTTMSDPREQMVVSSSVFSFVMKTQRSHLFMHVPMFICFSVSVFDVPTFYVLFYFIFFLSV